MNNNEWIDEESERVFCCECEEEIQYFEPVLSYDGEPCHMNCAARAMDEAQWDSDMGCG